MVKPSATTKLTKSEKQAQKQAKKEKNRKSKAEREAEVEYIKNRYTELEIDESYEAISELYKQMQHYVDTGETVQGVRHWEEAPPQPLGRNIHYFFSSKKGSKSFADLRIPGHNDPKFKGINMAKVPRSQLPEFHVPPPSSSLSSLAQPISSLPPAPSDEAPQLIPTSTNAEKTETATSTKNAEPTNIVDQISQILHNMQIQAQKEGRTLTNNEIRQVAEKYLPTPADIQTALDEEFSLSGSTIPLIASDADGDGGNNPWNSFLQKNTISAINNAESLSSLLPPLFNANNNNSTSTNTDINYYNNEEANVHAVEIIEE